MSSAVDVMRRSPQNVLVVLRSIAIDAMLTPALRYTPVVTDAPLVPLGPTRVLRETDRVRLSAREGFQFHSGYGEFAPCAIEPCLAIITSRFQTTQIVKPLAKVPISC
ncbi:hypothetical protein TNCV_2622951 [Trichonephila clavipes]|nr:hypothetical protein TNCV_2622951 [Trichonephila clavipes]